MNYKKTTDFLFKQFPAFQKKGESAYKPGLDRVSKLSKLVANPHKKFKSIHIAGTNGKGSCSHMMASIMQEAGYKVGLFTSPHLKDFRERIKINGIEIPEQKVIDFVSRLKHKTTSIKPSFFEYTTIMAFEYFADQKVDIAIIETGLGGRLDCSNIIKPEISIITNIGFDHQQFLGNTLTKIAKEKAGIIKTNTPVVIGRRQHETIDVFNFFSRKKQSKIIWADEVNCNFKLDLLGSYQKENSRTVFAAINELKNQGWEISTNTIKSGFEKSIQNTGIKGRWDILQETPKVICDTGHNEDGVNQIVRQLNDLNFNQLHIVWGMTNDKDISKILTLLPEKANYYWCSPKIERALKTDDLEINATKFKLKGKKYDSVKKALNKAILNASDEDLIFIGGSTFVVAEAL
ncbi:MAG: tetrahydrofolate synthase [Flavobacteriales bacterium]|nr:tetrahydrofolate synthase [Flavobacteriales bacterium]